MQNTQQTARQTITTLKNFWTKFNNDGAWNNAAGLAYNLILSMFPFVLALFALLGLLISNTHSELYQQIVERLTGLLPAETSSQAIVAAALQELSRQSGILGLIALGFAIFNGSRLFLFLEGCFDIIYHVPRRGLIAQNVVAIGMVLLFILLVPVLIITSTGASLLIAFLRDIMQLQIPTDSIFPNGSIIGGLVAGYLLLQSIYIVVPNRWIGLRKSWPGSVLGAISLQIYMQFFPFYATHFLGSFVGGGLGLLILLIFFYYFAMILFLGAEINAFFCQGIRETPYDLVALVHTAANVLPTEKQDR